MDIGGLTFQLFSVDTVPCISAVLGVGTQGLSQFSLSGAPYTLVCRTWLYGVGGLGINNWFAPG